jgi:hypothetical protein
MNYEWIGWCREGVHDKVWGAIRLEDPEYSYTAGKFVTFWGRRGKKLQTKIVEDTTWGIHKMFLKKQDKGYKEVDKNLLDEVYPEFENDLKQTAFWATLKG